MKWVGLTGGIASGKTTVANLFRERGIPVIDADQLAHSALLKNKDKIISYFGPEIVDENDELDRRKLGEKVFANPKLLKKLESIIHPYVLNKVAEKRRLFEVSGQSLVIYDVPLLFEKDLQDQFDEVIVVYVPEQTSKERLMLRNGLTEKEADDRLANQINIEKKKELADVVFSNEGDKDDLKNLVTEYLQKQAE